MDHGKPGLSPCELYTRILKNLEKELVELDRCGAHKVGAHLDAAIQQLHRDLAVLRATTAGKGATPSPAQKAAILAPFSNAFSEAIGGPQVLTRTAKPANSG